MAVSKNVYELAQERLRIVFKEFDTISCRFPEGKTAACC